MFLAFTSLEVRFLEDSSSCSNDKSLTNAMVMMIPYFFDQTPYRQTCEITPCITWPSYLCAHGKMRRLIKKGEEREEKEDRQGGKKHTTMFPIFSLSVLTIGILLVVEELNCSVANLSLHLLWHC